MAWWHRKFPDDGWTSKVSEAPLPEIVEAKPGEIIPCDDPKKVVIVPKDPEPDLSTKPKDVVGYCFGYACPKKHVFGTFETISIDGFKERRVCQKCGGVGKPATVKRTAEARWGYLSRRDSFTGTATNSGWGWFNYYWKYIGRSYHSYPASDLYWTNHEFVHYLESPKRRKK